MKFLKPPYDHHRFPKYADHKNEVVNLDLVTSVGVGRQAYYPDNKGIFTVCFNFTGGTKHQWYMNGEKDAQKIVDALSEKIEV